MNSLSKRQPRRQLVFTSAGDRSNLKHWLDGPREFDLVVVFYGDEPNDYADVCEYYFVRKGSKFGNLNYLYQTQPELLRDYDSVLVMDDDILISAESINRLFQLFSEQDWWLAQPAFSPVGKISWPITRVQPRCRWRYTNFVEMGAPLFRRDKLDDFMRVFDPEITGTGTDHWFMESLGTEIIGKVAVVDEVTCINPRDHSKGGQRECDLLEGETERSRAWGRIQAKYGVKRVEHTENGVQMKPLVDGLVSTFSHWPSNAYVFLRERLFSHLKPIIYRWVGSG